MQDVGIFQSKCTTTRVGNFRCLFIFRLIYGMVHARSVSLNLLLHNSIYMHWKQNALNVHRISIFFSSRFPYHLMTDSHKQIKKKKLKKLLNMAVKTIIIWYRLGHDECLKFQTRHSQFFQFQKDLHSLFYRKTAGVKLKQQLAFDSNHQNPNKNPTNTRRHTHFYSLTHNHWMNKSLSLSLSTPEHNTTSKPPKFTICFALFTAFPPPPSFSSAKIAQSLP